MGINKTDFKGAIQITGKLKTCPFCADALSNSYAGVRARIKMHSRRGQLEESKVLETTMKVLGRELFKRGSD